ncbi:MAG: zinc metalloprotease HtpX [Methylomicrobium sp.]
MASYLALLGWVFSGLDGLFALTIAGLFAIILNPTLSPHWLMHLYGAIPITPDQAPDLYQLLLKIAQRSRLKTLPVLYRIPSSTLNAFTTGSQNHAAIAITDGLLDQLNLRELTGVLAHEASHIRNNDIWIMSLADLFSRGTSLLSLFGQLLLLINLPLVLLTDVVFNWPFVLLMIFAPYISTLTQLALSRTREFDADLCAAEVTGDPRGLASALEKIEQAHYSFWERIFFPGRRDSTPSVLRTHPPTEERIKRLLELESDRSFQMIAYPELLDYRAQFGNRRFQRPRRHISGLWF